MQVWAPTTVIFNLCDRESERETKNDLTVFFREMCFIFFSQILQYFNIWRNLIKHVYAIMSWRWCNCLGGLNTEW